MADTDWLTGATAADLEDVRLALLGTALSQGSGRKQRLLACAFVRRTWSLLPKACRKGVEVAERFADGGASVKEVLVGARRTTLRAEMASAARPDVGHAAWAALFTLVPFPHGNALDAANQARRALLLAGADPQTELLTQCLLLQEIFGLPYRPVSLLESWRSWNDACIVRLAQRIYDERRYGDLPILHDALLDAGCDEEQILAHCCEPTGHERGCWVLDLILGRK